MLRNFKYIIPVAFAALVVTSCKKGTFDINVDPNNPASLPANRLIPTIESSFGAANELTSGVSSILEVYMHRIVVRENANGYNSNPGDVGGMWDQHYEITLTNANIVIDQSVKGDNLRYAGIAKVLKAYAFSQILDTYGNLPYTDANQLTTLVKNPKFDDDAVVYPKLIALLDEGISNMNNTGSKNLLKPGVDDVIYGGDMAKWTKAANALKLKLYTQERLVKNVSVETSALLTGGGLMTATADGFLLPHSKDNKNAAYSEYSATQKTQYISPWFYEIMKGYNTKIFTGYADPRIPYYFYNQITAGQPTTNDNNPTEYRDGSFVSIYFGSTGVNAGFSQQKTLTTVGIYPAGGLYDAGAGGPLTANSASGAAPFRMLSYADQLFLQAELIKTGVVTGDARAVLLAAITESFKLVDYVVTKTGNTAPVLATTTATQTYINSVMNEYDLNPAKQLQIIMTQKWIQGFGGNAVDAYSDYRRTGFPILFNPNDPTMAPGGKVQPPPAGNPLLASQPAVPVSLNRSFPVSLYWPSEELDANSNAPAQKDPATYKVFWQP